MAIDEGTIEERLSGHMSFLEHLDEFRKRLVRSALIIGVAFCICWFFSDQIYNFLAIPVQEALTRAERREVPLSGRKGDEKLLPLKGVKEGDTGLYVFDRPTNIGNIPVAAGTSVMAIVSRDSTGNPGLFTEQIIYTSDTVLPKGVKLPVDFRVEKDPTKEANERMVITTAVEPFTLYVTVSLYAAIALSIPFLLFEIWGFISPALYKHERKYVTPFIFLSTISFVVGAAFAYYILFPPAVAYLLGLGSDFQLLLRATDYFEFITLIMLAMGIIFQMPAVSYVLSRIGVISAGFLVKSWKVALVLILIIAAFISPTGDIPNMMLFATPMAVLYLVSIGIAWFFGKKRETD
ncbi:MAG: twin-arginine translocase subunit TatC [Acidobacteriota bacterium]|nr:twin-arginine translocase subunit TatC [Acidobacteriota bacterium]MDH3527921.1 twin-arginine translocase subunit TatC [Acidobacteriota bacterium]